VKRIVLSVMVALAVVRPAHAQAPAGGESFLHPGDAVRVTVWRKPELSGDFQVAADGTVKHPLYRELRVTGVPMDSVQARLRLLLAGYESDPQFLVEPLFRVAVAGEVRKPDLYTLPMETTIAQALAMAGGATERGKLDHVKLIRDSREELLDLSRPETGAASRTIRSGDQILVGRSGNILRDYVGPFASILAASGVLLNVLTR
jgi:protein involved in polysaccharide export with SLBB domain